MQMINPSASLGLPKETFRLGNIMCCLLETADGSFSLRYSTSPQEPLWTEPMHSSKGAWSETLFVYEPALRESLAHSETQSIWGVASIGLGLGYNELLCASMALRAGKSPESIKIISFESQSELRDAFKKSFLIPEGASDLPYPLLLAQKAILDIICRFVGVSENELRDYLEILAKCQSLLLFGPWTMTSHQIFDFIPQVYQCILFDAFSPDSSPDLWNEDVLNNLIDSLGHQHCIFASYASRNSLKKILRKKGFNMEATKGFAGKRERTFARRI